ncbi:MAG TPA: VanZ family protein, partial [Puia sp.]|nr:VanZ family protein [Puia sp.]
FSGWYIPVIWSLIMAVLLFMPGSMLPHENTFAIPQFDKIVHIGIFGGFVFLWNLYLSSRSLPLKRLLVLFFVIFLVGITYGIGSEYIQKYFIPGRDYDQGDIIADIIGAGLAYGISNIVLLSSFGREGSKNRPL